jgi:hypothetical protein
MSGIDPWQVRYEPTMPGYLACGGADPSARDRDFQASVVGDRVIDRQASEPLLVAFQPRQAGIMASLSVK